MFIKKNLSTHRLLIKRWNIFNVNVSTINDISVKKCLLPSVEVHNQDKWPSEILNRFLEDCTVQTNFITEDQEAELLAEIEPHMKRMKWDEEHWDQQIHLYREGEQSKWNSKNQKLIERIWTTSFPDRNRCSPFVHILDLHADGFIRPHLDEARYCGRIICGLSLLSSSIMRLQHCDDCLADLLRADLLLPRRSLYKLSGIARFEFKHAILGNSESCFRNQQIPRERRISVICRELPEQQPKNVYKSTENGSWRDETTNTESNKAITSSIDPISLNRKNCIVNRGRHIQAIAHAPTFYQRE